MKWRFILPVFALLAVCAAVTSYFLVFQNRMEVLPLESLNHEYLLCIGLTDDVAIAECLDQLAQRVYKLHPTKDIASELDTLTYQQKNHWCHEFMHFMGWQAYDVEGDVAEAFLNSSELCDSGMYHGVMEGYLRTEGLAGNIEELVRSVCTNSLASNPRISEGLMGLCYHGLGHGLMYVTSSDLKKSLEYCDALPKYEEYGACYTGAFMEFVASKEIGPLANTRDLSDFSYCNELNERHKKICFLRQGLSNVSVANGDIELAMKMCLEVPAIYLEECFRGVGGNNPSPGKSHTDAGEDCLGALNVSEKAYEQCISGSLGFVLQLEWGDMQGAREFCEKIDSNYLNYCYEEAGRLDVSWRNKSESATTTCSAFPTEESQRSCVRGIAQGS